MQLDHGFGPTKLVLLHNFRTGGNGLFHVFFESYPERIFKLGGYGESFHYFEDFIAAGKNSQVRLFFGHFCFGVAREVVGPVSYMTSLRSPVDRLISGLSWKKEDETIDSWLKRSFETENGMTKRLCGYGQVYEPGMSEKERYIDFRTGEEIPKNIQMTEDHYRIAAANILQSVEHIFLVDKLEECKLLFERQYGITPLLSLNPRHINTSVFKLGSVEVSPALVDRLAEQNQFDLRLYRLGRDLVQAQIDRQPPVFWDQVRIRKILAKMICSGQQTESSQEVTRRIETGFNKLCFFGMWDEVIGVAETIISLRKLAVSAKKGLAAWLHGRLPPDQRDRLRASLVRHVEQP